MLKYTGGGYGGWLPNVPAKDLTDDEVKASGFTEAQLIDSGIYTRPDEVLVAVPAAKAFDPQPFDPTPQSV